LLRLDELSFCHLILFSDIFLAFDDALSSMIGAELLVSIIDYFINQEQPHEFSRGITIQELISVFLLEFSLALSAGTFEFLNLSRHIHHPVVKMRQASLCLLSPLEDGNRGKVTFIDAYCALEDQYVICQEILVRFYHRIL
jgi:hypothetical protein